MKVTNIIHPRDLRHQQRASRPIHVVASPDPTRGEIVKAFVVLKSGWEPSKQLAQELQEHVKAVTAPYKYPREVEFVKELPKTVSGKIRRVELRESKNNKNMLIRDLDMCFRGL